MGNTFLGGESNSPKKTDNWLTKREHMAIEFTKAMITHYGVHQGTSEKGVKYAIEWTDELIKQLNEAE